MRVSEAFSKVCDLGMSLGIRSINKLPGCWEHRIDDHWWIALNAHPEAVKCSEGADVPPFTVYVMFNGWPAGFIAPDGGTMAAGAAANEDELIAALDRAIKAVA